MDSAWELKQYDVVLKLLQEDHEFPDEFDVETLNENDETQRDIKLIAEERNRLHEWIENDRLREVQDFTSKNQSKYYFNIENESAAYTALYNRKFKIYAYLQSIGVNLTNYEVDEMKNLTDMEKHELKDIMLSYLPRDEKSHIYHLMSKIKIKSQKPFEQCREQLFGYLEKLNQIPQVSIILKVIQHVEHLDLVLELDEENVKNVCPPATQSEKGITFRYLSTIYVAAGGGRTENKILGTLAHELTHMAMHAVFSNDCKPYFKSDDVKPNEFYTITANVKKSVRRVPDTPSETICDAFDSFYTSAGEEEDEVIARVPHILAQYPDGGDWLSSNAPDLAKFFDNKVIPECQRFISENSLSKFRNLNRFMNESEGDIVNIKKSALAFSNIDEIKHFLSTPDKQVFALITKYTWLGLLRALQATYGINYVESYNKFLVFKLENIFKISGDVEYLFNSEATEKLFIECPGNLDDNCRISREIKGIMEIVEKNKKKKVILVTKDEDTENIAQIVKNCGLDETFVSETDDDFSARDLIENSRQKLLDKKILFQGTECNLSELINDNEDLLKLINAEIMQDLIDNKNIELGSKPLGMSSLEGAYADIVYEVNLLALIHEIKSTEHIFVISSKKVSNQRKEILKCLNQNISVLAGLKNFECQIPSNKRIFLTNEEVNDDDFKKFCSFNPDKKVYFLKYLKECNFLLLKIYVPDFYFERNFKRQKEIIVKKDILDKEASGEIVDTLIVSTDNPNKIPNFDSPNIRFLNAEESVLEFEKLQESRTAAHLLKFKNNELVWQKSSKSLSGLRPWIDKTSSAKTFTGENELRADIINEKVVILADEPGMGKSTTLTKLYDDKNIINTHWVIRINLKDHLKAIQNIKDNLDDVKEVIKFLTEVDVSLKNSITKKFLRAAISINTTFPKQLLLCFDGFDELLDEEDRTKVINLLIFLKDKANCKIWISTRLHYKEVLEDALLLFSLTFNPIDDSSKKDFIRNYMKNRLRLTLTTDKYNEIFEVNINFEVDSELEIFIKRFLEKAKEIFKYNIEKFIGTPLQLHLLLEGSALFFQNWIENSSDLDFSYLGNNLVDVYEKYFDRRYDIYFRKEHLLEKTSKRVRKNELEKYHEQLADSLVNNKPLISEVDLNKSILLLLGITKDEGENIQFVHFTFREYFFTQFLIRILSNRETEKCQQLYELFMKKILVEDKYYLIRSFINAHLENTEQKILFKSHVEGFESVILFGILQACFVSIRDHNNEIVDFLLSFNYSLDTIQSVLSSHRTDNFLLHLFNLATRAENDFALNRIIELASKHNLDQQLLSAATFQREEAAIIVATKSKNNFAFNRIIELATKHQSLNQQLLNSLNITGITAFHIAVSFKNDFAFNRIMEFALKNNSDQQILTAVGTNKNTAFHIAVEEGNHYAFNRILELASKYNLDQQILTAVNKSGNTAFHLAVLFKNDYAADRIIELSSKHNLDQQLLTAVDEYNETAFHLAVYKENDYAVNRILELASKYNLDQEMLTAVNQNKNTAFHTAVEYGNDHAFNRILELASKYNLDQQILTAVDENKNTAFHIAVEYKNNYAFNQIIELASKYNLDQQILTAANAFGNTVFHLAAKKKNDFAADRIIELSSKYNLDQQLLTAVGEGNETAFLIAVFRKNDFAVNRIIELASKYNSDQQILTAVDENNNTAFHLAVYMKNDLAVDKIIELASKHNLDKELLTAVDKSKEISFHDAVRKKNDYALNKIIELSSKHSLDQQLLTAVNAFGNTAFHTAVLLKNDFAVNRIIELASKNNLNQQLLTAVNDNSDTAFHSAVVIKNDFAVNRIIELASEYNLVQQMLTSADKDNYRAFYLAIWNKNDFAVNCIIEIASKYDLDQQLLTAVDEFGNTAFQLAIEKKNDFAVNQIIELASKNNLDKQILTAVNAFGNTALHFAVWSRNKFAVDRIIELASKNNLEQHLLTAVNDEQETVIEVAIKKKNEYILNRIIELTLKNN